MERFILLLDYLEQGGLIPPIPKHLKIGEKIPDLALYHPKAEKISFEADGLYSTFYEERSKLDIEDLPFALNTAHRTVCETVYTENLERDVLYLAQNMLKANIVSSEAENSDWQYFYSTFKTSEDFISTVKISLDESILNSDFITTSIIVDAAYHAFTRVGQADIVAEGEEDTGEEQEDFVEEFFYLSNEDPSTTVTEAVYEAQLNTNLMPTSIIEDDLIEENYTTAEELHTIINEALSKAESYEALTKIIDHLTTTPKFPGIFENLEAYMAWYQLEGLVKDNNPWIGIATYDSAYNADDIEMHLALLESLENKGANVLLAFVKSSEKVALLDRFFIRDGKTIIDAYISAMHFNYVMGNVEASVESFKKLNVPILAPVYSSDLDKWETDPTGITKEMYMQVIMPEMDGQIEPIFMGGTRKVIDPHTGIVRMKKVPLQYNIERLAGRAMSWARLRIAENADKKLALVYYNHDGGKDGIGAIYLNVMESAANVLKALKDEGYNVQGNTDVEAIQHMIMNQGRNVGSWAPGEMQKLVDAGIMTIDLDQYLRWYEKLPEKLREQVEKEWGPAPGNIMVMDGKILIPGVKMGNVFVGPQPMRGWGEDPSKIIQSPVLPPPHQYIAFYLWLQNEWKADAVIHLGAHGTLEWLPGKSVGMGEYDWPDQMIGNMVNINPYIINNPGEATQSKRRGYGVTIGHGIPAMQQPKLYGELLTLQNLIIEYLDTMTPPDRAEALKEQIIISVQSQGMEYLNLDFTNDFDNSVLKLRQHLQDFTRELMPYGLHTLGRPLQGDLLDIMVDAIVAYDPANREANRQQIRDNLLRTTQEVDNVIRALNGEYIEPGPGKDPIRDPNALPTGRNITTFDPREMPDRAAWATGKQAADLLIQRYKEEHGRDPESVGFVLWAIETMRTRGESIAMIMRLIGVEPEWDNNDRVHNVIVTPISELGRPRIDVVATISGLFRDTFPHVIEILDEAFRMVALLDESPNNNFVKKHYDMLFQQLKNSGMNDSMADMLAGARIFGGEPGSYGTGLAKVVENTTAWDTQADLGEAYMSRMSYIYGKNVFGEPARDVFTSALKNIDLVTMARDSIWGILDNDDVSQYLGGLKLAAETASGKSVDSYIINTREAGTPRIQTLAEFIGTEIRSRILNPTWIEGMLKEGYAGSYEIGDQIFNMFLIDATAGAIDDWAWKKVAETYILDQATLGQLNPHIAQSIIGWAMEAARRDMWNADNETLKQLADIYIQTAVEYGVVCCHHTCGSISFNEWVASYSMLDQSALSSFKEVFKEATAVDLNIPTGETPIDPSPVAPAPSPEVPAPSPEVSKEETKIELDKEVKETILSEDQQVKDTEDIIEETDIQIETPQQKEVKTPEEPIIETPQKTAENNLQEREEVLQNNPVMLSAGETNTEDTPKQQVNLSQAGIEADQQEEAIENEDEASDETELRAYEINVEDNKKSVGENAVAFTAIVMGLGLVGIILKGYLKKASIKK